MAGDGIFVAVDILDSWTVNGGHSESRTYRHSTPTVCNTSDSNYTVTWSVTRKADVLDLSGVTADGGVWHTIRHADGSWDSFGDVRGQAGNPGTFVDIGTAGSLHDELHLCGTTSDGGLWHTIRHADVVGSWQSFRDVRGPAGNPGAFQRVGAAVVFADLHICGITPNDGNIRHTIRHADSTWTQFIDVESQAGNVGTFVDVGNAGVVGELHLCGTTLDGGLWHTIRHIDGTWTQFGDVKSQAGNPGTFQRVGIAAVFNELHVCGITSDGGVWHTIRHSDGTWTQFGDVKGVAGDIGSFVSISGTELFMTVTDAPIL